MANIRVKLADGRTGTMSEEEFTSGGWGAKGAKRLDGGVASAPAAPAPSPAAPKQYGKVETFLRNGLGGSLYGFGEEVAAAIRAVPPVSPTGMPVKMPNGYTPPSTETAYDDLVRERKESAAQNPKTAVLGELTGAVVGSPLPGGPLAKGGSLLKSTARLAGRGAVASGVGAAGMAEGGIRERLKAGAVAAPLGAVLSGGLGAVASGIARKPGSFQAPKLGYNPLSGAWANPESLKESAGAARISALRPTPSSLENINREFGSVEAFGRKINEAKNPVSGAPLIKKNFDAPKMDRAFEVARKRSGETIGRLERKADEAGAQVDLGEYLGKVSAGPKTKLTANRTRATERAATAQSFMDDVTQTASPPKVEVLQFPPPVVQGQKIVQKPTGLPKYELSEPLPVSGVRQGNVGPDGMREVVAGPAFERPTLRTGVELHPGKSPPRPSTSRLVDDFGRPVDPANPVPGVRTHSVKSFSGPQQQPKLYEGAPTYKLGEPAQTVAPGQPADTVFERAAQRVGQEARGAYEDAPIRILPNPVSEVTPRFIPASHLASTGRHLREAGSEFGSFVGEQTHPLGKTLGSAYDEAAGIAVGMAKDSTSKALGPAGAAKLDAAKDLFSVAQRGDETVKAFRGAAGAPRSLSQVAEGAAASQVGGMVAGMPGAIAGRQAGFVLGHQSAINPAKAWNRQRLAEGIEGNGLHLGWDVAGGAVRGAQALPDRLIRGAGIMAGDEVADVVEDPTRADLDFNDVRAKALRRFLLGE
jgi:hypothetical protein